MDEFVEEQLAARIALRVVLAMTEEDSLPNRERASTEGISGLMRVSVVHQPYVTDVVTCRSFEPTANLSR